MILSVMSCGPEAKGFVYTDSAYEGAMTGQFDGDDSSMTGEGNNREVEHVSARRHDPGRNASPPGAIFSAVTAGPGVAVLV
jgi:hypothetical protein